MIQETRLQDVPRTDVGALPRDMGYDYRLATRRMSWGAIIAGVFTAISVQTILMVLGAAIGLSVAAAANPSTNNDVSTGISVGAGIWTLIVSIASLFAGGWVTAKLSGIRNELDCTIHGFVMWATATVLSLVLLTSAGMAVLGNAVNAASNVAGPVAARMTSNNNSGTGSQSGMVPGTLNNPITNGTSSAQDLDNFIQQHLQQLNVSSDGTQSELVNTLQSAIQSPSPGASQSQNAAEMLATRGNMSRTEAQQTIDRWRQEYQQNSGSSAVNQAQVRNAADRATKTAAGVSWWTFFALLLGVAAACLGGYTGTPGRSDDLNRRMT